jgi:hypothetical protein
MDQGPLVSEQINSGARFLAEFQKYRPVQSAFWLKDGDEGAWYLYVASEQITDDNFDVAYREVGQVADTLRDPEFDVFRVKVIGTDHPLAQAVLDLRRHYPGRTRFHLDGRRIGIVSVEELYLYPSPVPAPVR